MPLRVLWSEVVKLEQVAEELSRSFGDDQHVGFGNPLQARCKVGCFANDAVLLRFTRSDQIADHDQAGRDADPGLQSSV